MAEVQSNEIECGRDPTDALNETFRFKKGLGSTLVLACGALAREVVWLVETNELRHLDVQRLPARLHHTPDKIPGAVRTQIRAHKRDYEKIFVVFGDCGTAGALDRDQ